MAVEIGELETRVEAGPAPNGRAQPPQPGPAPRELGVLLRRHLARRVRLVAD